MRWYLSNRADDYALPLADGHYSRQKPGTKQFVKPGRCIVLLTKPLDALWVTSYPYSQYCHHEWSGAWECSMFRNTNPYRQRTGKGNLSSELIREAVAATIWASYTYPKWFPPGPSPLGMITFINRSKVRPKERYGECYLQAGFEVVGETKQDKLLALQLKPENMPQMCSPHLTWLEIEEAS